MAGPEPKAKRNAYGSIKRTEILEWPVQRSAATINSLYGDRAIADDTVEGAATGADYAVAERFRLPEKLVQDAMVLSLKADVLTDQVSTLAKSLRASSDTVLTAPAAFIGELILPNGSPGAGLAVTLRLRSPEGDAEDEIAFRPKVTVSDQGGRFSIPLGSVPLPPQGLELVAEGANTIATLSIASPLVASGRAGTVMLDRMLAPVPDAFRAALADDGMGRADQSIALGEENCARRFRSNAGVIDRYRWNTLIRLVEPKVYPPQGQTDTGGAVPDDPVSTLDALIFREGASRVGMRVPIGAPINVDQFRSDLESDPANVPKAGSIGLGYVLRMSQAWIPRGLSLGNLLYSLPLAPGEEQRIVVSESIERLTVREHERASLRETQSQTDQISRTTSQLFQSSLQEAASGGSSFEQEGSSSQVGGGFSILGFGMSGGGSWSSSNGGSSSNQNLSRDFASWAAESFHGSLSRRAAISRDTSNVSVRLATIEDRDEVASKLVANYNRNHALTLQYWEVMRNFTVTSDVDGVSLTCFVPLEVIPWTVLQSGADGPSGSLSTTPTRDYLVKRYATVLRHADVLRRRLRFRPRMRRALANIEALAANPMITVDNASEARRLSLRVSVSGTFLPFDELSATVITSAGRRIGPSRLTPASIEEPVARVPINRGDLVDALLARREDTAGAESTRAAHLVLPNSVSAADIARIEVSHRMTSWTYQPPDWDAHESEDGVLKIHRESLEPKARRAISLTARDLTQLVGAPRVWDVEVESLDQEGDTIAQDYTGVDSAIRMTARLVVTPDPEDPVFGNEELQLAEELLTHLRENALRYSKAVWGDLTPDALVLMLEPFTVGLPLGDGTLSEVPLVSCISTRIMGFFGNAMVLPFHIPAQMAAETGTTSGEIEDRLLRFHRQAFRPPRTEIALPSGGMLGEAILGACNSAEKIDLTRLWNRKDAPLPRLADDPNGDLFKAERLLGTKAAEGPTGLSAFAAPAYSINPSTLPTSGQTLAQLLAQLPKSQLPSDLDASELAKTFAAQGFKNAGALATDVVSQVQAANNETGPSVSDLIELTNAMRDKAQAFQSLGVEKFISDPGSIAELIGSAPAGEQNAMAQGIVQEMTGGAALSASQKAGVFGALQSLAGGTGAAAGAGSSTAASLGIKALLLAFGLPPII